MTDAFVLDDDGEDDTLSAGEFVRDRAQGSDELVRAGAVDFGLAGLQAKDVDVEDVRLEELRDALGLFLVVIILRDDGVGSKPAMAGELSILCAVVHGLQSFTLHVAGLAGGDDVLLVEGQGRLFGEGGVLPLVIQGDGSLPLVVVEGFGKCSFVAGGAELAGTVERLHDGGGVAIEVSEDLRVTYRAMDGLAVFIDQDSGLGENEARGSACINALDGVTDHAGDAVLVVGTLAGCAFGDSTGDDGDGVMAAFAMAGVGDALFGVEQVDVAEVPGGAIGVGVGRLTPLSVGFLVTMRAILCRGKALGVDEFAVVSGDIGR